jgi:hypothetical protein
MTISRWISFLALIPKRYYKVILDFKEPDLKAIGFILPNESRSCLNMDSYSFVPIAINIVHTRTSSISIS